MADRRIRIGSLGAALLLPFAAFAEAAPQDFSGEWVLPAKDQIAPAGTSSSPDSASRHGGHGGGGGMGAGGHHHGDASGGSGGARGGDSSMQSVDPRVAAQALTIRQSEIVFDVAAQGGKRMVYRFDNRNNYGPDYGGTVTLTWSAPDMVIETHPDAGGSIEERYTLSADGKQLIQHVHEQRAGSDASRDFTRVFVRQQNQP